MYAEIHGRRTLSNEITQDHKKYLSKGALHMADKFLMKCGLLACGVLLAATVPAFAESAAPARPTGQAGQSLAISGKVTVASSLAGKGSATDTLFVFAREVNGPPMPVAIVRATKKDLPFTFRLDDTTGMMPSRKLSDVGTVVIVARLSKSGKAMPESGDLEGISQPVKPGADGITIVIDRERP
jgi:cytochrome c-type biogenesis protein CcmH